MKHYLQVVSFVIAPSEIMPFEQLQRPFGDNLLQIRHLVAKNLDLVGGGDSRGIACQPFLPTERNSIDQIQARRSLHEGAAPRSTFSDLLMLTEITS